MPDTIQTSLLIRTLDGIRMRFERHPQLYGLLAALVTVTVFLPALRYPFLFDDEMLIVGNENLSWGHLAHLLTIPFWQIQLESLPGEYLHLGRFYRPVILFSYLLDKTIYHMQPWGFHLTNVLFQGINAYLVFRLLCRFTAAPWLAGMLALLFGVHPNNSEVVGLIHGRTDLFASVFMLAALAVYVECPVRKWTSGALLGFALLFALALGSKESSVMTVLLMAGCHALGGIRGADMDMRSRFRYYVASLAVLGGYFLLRLYALEEVPAGIGVGVTAVARQAQMVGLQFLRQMTAFLIPWGSFALVPRISFDAHTFTLELLLVTALLWLAFRRNYRLACFALLWFLSFTCLSIVGGATIYAGDLEHLSKRYAHQAMPGMLLLVSLAVYRPAWTSRWQKRTAAGLLIMACAMIVQLCWRNETYINQTTFWATRAAECPGDDMPHYNYGRLLLADGRLTEAITELERAIAINPRYMSGYPQANLAIALLNAGKIDQASVVIRAGLELFPNHPSLLRLQEHVGRQLSDRSPAGRTMPAGGGTGSGK